MTFEALNQLPTTILIHVASALLALVIGPFALFRRSRDKWHRRAGYLWVAAMVSTAVSSFWINGIGLVGPFSPIHLLSLFVLWGLYEGLRNVRRGNIAAHRAGMQALYVYAICVTGLFTLAPGRLLNEILLDGVNGWLLAGVLVTFGVIIISLHRRSVLPLGKAKGLH